MDPNAESVARNLLEQIISKMVQECKGNKNLILSVINSITNLVNHVLSETELKETIEVALKTVNRERSAASSTTSSSGSQNLTRGLYPTTSGTTSGTTSSSSSTTSSNNSHPITVRSLIAKLEEKHRGRKQLIFLENISKKLISLNWKPGQIIESLILADKFSSFISGDHKSATRACQARGALISTISSRMFLVETPYIARVFRELMPKHGHIITKFKCYPSDSTETANIFTKNAVEAFKNIELLIDCMIDFKKCADSNSNLRDVLLNTALKIDKFSKNRRGIDQVQSKLHQREQTLRQQSARSRNDTYTPERNRMERTRRHSQTRNPYDYPSRHAPRERDHDTRYYHADPRYDMRHVPHERDRVPLYYHTEPGFRGPIQVSDYSRHMPREGDRVPIYYHVEPGFNTVPAQDDYTPEFVPDPRLASEERQASSRSSLL